MKELLRKISREEGQGLTEYGLILVLAFFAALGAISAVADQINEMYQFILTTLGSI